VRHPARCRTLTTVSRKIAILLVAIGFKLLGDSLRGALDPRLKR